MIFQEILTDNPLINLHHNLKDTHVSICSASALPLFADNFDFQTKSDFIRGLLMNEEIMGSTIYWHQINSDQYGAAVTNWRMYQLIRSVFLEYKKSYSDWISVFPVEMY